MFEYQLHLEYKNAVFNEKYYLHEDGTAIRPYMPCSYSYSAMYRFDLKTLRYKPETFC